MFDSCIMYTRDKMPHN